MNNEVRFNIKLNIDGKDKLVTVTTAVDNLKHVVSSVNEAAKDLEKDLINTNQITEAWNNVTNALQQFSGTLNSLTAESRSFGGAMAAANTMAGKGGDDFAHLKEQVAGLSHVVPVARDELANGLYQVISNGVPEDNWISYLKQSAEASVGGIADLGEVVKVTSTVIKNYGLEWSDAGAIQDKIQLTAKNGVTSFEQMAQALPRVTANAATLGVSIDELMASFATLTGVSGNTAEVSTQLAAIFTALINPSSEATEMAQQMGIQFDAAAIKAAGGMQQFLVSLNDSVKQFSTSSGMLEQEIYGKLFGSAESLRAITPLVGNLADAFQKNVEGMADSAGTIKDAFGSMGSTGSAQLQLLQNKLAAFSDFATTVFGPILPALNIAAQVSLTATSVMSLCRSFSALGITTKAASFLMQAFGPIVQVCSATMRGAAVSATTLKLAIKGLMISTGVGIAIVALTEAISAFMAKSDAAKLSAEDMADGIKSTGDAADDVKEAYDSSLKSTYSDLMEKYEKLKAGWKSLSTEQQKTAWIKQNQSAFHDLRLKIDDVADAENIFNKKTNAVVDAFKQRAMAAAYAAKLTALYQKQIALLDKKQKTTKDIADDAKRGGRNAKEGDLIPEGWRNERYGKVGNDGIWRFSKVGAERYSGTNTTGNKQVGGIDKELNSINRQIDDTQKQLSGRLKSASNFITADTPQRSTISTNTTPSPKTDNTPKTHLEELQSQLKKAQDELGNATTIEAKIKADAKVKDIQGEIDEATKGKVTIGAQVDSSYIVQGSDADKRLSRNNAQQRIDRIKQDYDIGIVTDKTDAQRDIDDINKQLTEMGLKPIEVHWETHTEELQRQLQDAQREFDNATTIEAKLKASAKLADLQAQIDTETKGRLTIAADVEPSYIEQGSIADKRQSYSNAQTKASRIQQDFEIGIIGKDEAEKQIEDLNNQLSKLGKSVKPIKLDPSSMVKTDGFSKVMGDIKEGWGDIQGVGGGIQSITDALDGNKNAWQALSGVINGFISVAEGIQGIVQFVNMLTTATQAKSAATTADTAVTAANTAVTTTNTAAKAGEAITNVTASGAKLPFPANIAAIAAGVAAVVAALAMISGAFADGGVVGGNSPSGDKLLARVNSGEMILNAAQQARLFAIADGTAAYGASAQIAANFAQGVALPSVSVQTDRLLGIMADGGGNQPKTVEWRLRGRDIVASIANETRSNRKRSNIRIK